MSKRRYNSEYVGEYVNRVAYPMGGIGSGMICLEGTGALSHVSLRHKPQIYHEPVLFAALAVPSRGFAKVLEGPVPSWKLYGQPESGLGAPDKTYGLPRFQRASFKSRFPFGTVKLEDGQCPLQVTITGWSPFVPGDADASSLPVAALEYMLENRSDQVVEGVFSFHAANFMAQGKTGAYVERLERGFVLQQAAVDEKPWVAGAFAVEIDDDDVAVNCGWFRGRRHETLLMTWRDVEAGRVVHRNPPIEGPPSPGGSLFVPFAVKPGETREIKLLLSWYVPHSDFYTVDRNHTHGSSTATVCKAESGSYAYRPWYTAQFPEIQSVATFWRGQYADLRRRTRSFTECFYTMDLPDEVIEAVAANLSILKSPTILRQHDGRVWTWEGCMDQHGCCPGSCTHVWSYAQALAHLFPELERGMRRTEFGESQGDDGRQAFRALLPIRPAKHYFRPASDGQLGAVVRVYRDWRISGDTDWLRAIWPAVKKCLEYCIETWDPDHTGTLTEPHHNTYDIDFWGPDGICGSIYIAALKAAVLIGEALGETVDVYRRLYEKGRRFLEDVLFDGDYFTQQVRWTDLHTEHPISRELADGTTRFVPEVVDIFKQEGPRNQYGIGCLSDGVIGAWMAEVCGIGEILDVEKVRRHLRSVYKYNFKRDLSDHVNVKRPGYAAGAEGGLVLCTWPKGGRPQLAFSYSDEVWTGVEYQVASHLMLVGLVEEGLEIVRACRDRYDGRVRNPFNEYECGHWYIRALSSYALIFGLAGVRYDRCSKTLFIAPSITGDFTSIFVTETGFGICGIKDGQPFHQVKEGEVDIAQVVYRASRQEDTI